MVAKRLLQRAAKRRIKKKHELELKATVNSKLMKLQKVRESEFDEELRKNVKPHIIAAYSWGRAQSDDPWSIIGRLTFHGLFGYRERVKDYKLKRFDKRFGGDENLKYRLMHNWRNCRKNNYACPLKRHRKHCLKSWRHEYYKHVYALQMSQKEFLTTACKQFEKFEGELDEALKASAGYCYGTMGSRRFRVKSFLTKLELKRIYPTIHVRDANCEVPKTQPIVKSMMSKLVPPKQVFLRESVKALVDVRIYLDMELNPIRSPSPSHPKGTVQGNYKPKEEVFLI